MVGDIEALRAHLRLERMDLLGHSAAANLAALYTRVVSGPAGSSWSC
jgi:pimeloyl-ACP methyl ester carboxylesterase